MEAFVGNSWTRGRARDIAGPEGRARDIAGSEGRARV